MAKPMALVTRIMYVVSLSARYRKITDWKNRFTSIDRTEMPSKDLGNP